VIFEQVVFFAGPYGDQELTRLDADGTLDATFGVNGVDSLGVGGPAYPFAPSGPFRGVNLERPSLAIQPDGKILLEGASVDPAHAGGGTSGFAGSGLGIALARFNADGTLDATFSPGSAYPAVATTPLSIVTAASGYALPGTVAVGLDGSIVAAATTVQGPAASLEIRLAAARYSASTTVPAGGPAGVLDPNFGNGAGYVTDLGLSFTNSTASATPAGGGALIASTAQDQGGHDVIELTRIGPDGKSLGTILPSADVGDSPSALIILPNGKILVGGSNATSGPFVLRLNADFTGDASFNGNSRVDLSRALGTGSASTDIFGGMALQADGKVVALIADGTTSTSLLVARFNPDGTLDPTFNATQTIQDGYDQPRALTELPDGNLLVAGNRLLTEYKADGSLFSVTPPPITPFQISAAPTSGGFYPQLGAIAVQPNADIVAAGAAVDGSGQVDLDVTRLNAFGAPDPSFNGNRTRLIRIAGGINLFDTKFGVQVLPNGQILVAGTVNQVPATGRITANGFTSANDAATAVVLLNADGTLDTSFGNDSPGVSLIGQDPADPTVAGSFLYSGLALRGDCDFVVEGQVNGGVALALLKPDGSVDTTFGTSGTGLATLASNGTGGFSLSPGAFAIQGDGRIIVGGNHGGMFAAARFTAGGKPDPTFGKSTTVVGLATYPIRANIYSPVLTLTPVAGDQAYLIGNSLATSKNGDVISLTIAKINLAPTTTPTPTPTPTPAVLQPPADFDGSGRSNLAIYYATGGEFLYQPTSGGPVVAVPFGVAGAGQSIPGAGRLHRRRPRRDRRLPAVAGHLRHPAGLRPRRRRPLRHPRRRPPRDRCLRPELRLVRLPAGRRGCRRDPGLRHGRPRDEPAGGGAGRGDLGRGAGAGRLEVVGPGVGGERGGVEVANGPGRPGGLLDDGPPVGPVGHRPGRERPVRPAHLNRNRPPHRTLVYLRPPDLLDFHLPGVRFAAILAGTAGSCQCSQTCPVGPRTQRLARPLGASPCGPLCCFSSA